MDVSAEGTGPESLVVRWTPLDPDTASPVLGYSVSYAVEGAPMGDVARRRLGGAHRSLVVLLRLRTFTRYSISVAAFNQIGLGPFSAAIFASTLQGGKFWGF